MERNTPRAQEIEWAVISAMMFEPESTVKKVIEAGEDIFYSPENVMVFKAIKHLFEHGDPIDQLTVSEQLRTQKQLDIVGGEQTISGFLGDTVSSAFIDYHIKILKDKALLRKIILLTESARNSCYDTSVDSSELLENMQTGIGELREYQTQKKLNLTEQVREFVMTTHDNFSTTNVYNYLDFTTRDNTKKVAVILGRLVTVYG